MRSRTPRAAARTALVAGLLAPLTPLLAGPVQAAGDPQSPRAAAAVSSISLEGRGFGHGHGLSQYGALGAAQQGLDHRRILSFYYPGTSLGQATGSIRVRLTELADDRLPVRAQRALTVAQIGKAATRLYSVDPKATWWRAVPYGTSGQTRVQRSRDGRIWVGYKTLSGTVQFSASSNALTLRQDDGALVRYRGQLRLASDGAGGRDVVNVVPLETYVRGVVPKEVPALWPRAAVQTQAVAARTYAVYERDHAPSGRYWDLCDTAACQVYGGASAEHPSSDSAISSVAGRVVTYAGSAIFAQFAASDGGWSSDGGQPYLVAQQDPYDNTSSNPYSTWTATIPASRIEGWCPSIGQLTGVSVTARDGNGVWGGRATTLTISGTNGSITGESADRFRSRMGLRSTWFRVL